MSGAQNTISRPPITTSSPPRPTMQPPTKTTVPPTGETGITDRALNALGRGAASVKRTKNKVGASLSEKGETVANFITGDLVKTDCLRRAQRLRELIADHSSDDRFKTVADLARTELARIEKVLEKPKPDFTNAGNYCTVVTEKLLAGIKEVKQQESKARNSNPTVSKALNTAAKSLDDAKQHMPADTHAGFTTELNLLKGKLTALPDKKQDKNGTQAKTLEQSAVTLDQKIKQAVTVNTDKQKQLELALAPIRKRLAAAPASPEAKSGDPRLVVSGLITEAENAIQAFDFVAAQSAITAAEKQLTTIKAPALNAIPDASATQQAVQVQMKRTQNLVTLAGKIPGESATVLTARVNGVVARLEGIEYALKKGGEAVAPDSARSVKECETILDGVNEAIKGFAEFQKKKKEQEKSFATEKNKVAKEASDLYARLGVPANAGPGEFQTRIADIEKRWAEALASSISLTELNLAAYLNELSALSGVISGSDTLTKEDVAVQQAISRYRTASAALTKAIGPVIEADSDKAISLGLTTKPAALQKTGDALASPQKAGSITQDKRISQLDAVTLQMTQLTTEAEKFNPQSVKFELDEQRRQCEVMVDQYKRRIQAVLDDVDVERKKVISVGTNKDERNNTTAYAKTVLSELETIAAPLVANDAGLLGDVRDNLAGFNKRVADLESLGPKGKEDKTLPSFSALQKRIDSLNKTLSKDSRFAARAEMTKPWTDELGKIEEDLTGADPRETAVVLTRIELAIEGGKKQAEVEHKLAVAAELELRNLAAAIVNGTGRYATIMSDSPTYAADLDARLLRLADQIKGADAPDDEAAKALKAEIEKATATGPNGLAARGTGEKTATEDAKKREDAKFALEKIKEVDLELLEEKASQMKGEARKQLFKQIKDLRTATDGALTSLELTGDVAAAKAMVDAIGLRVTRAADAPLGSSTRSRNNLPKVEERWVKAVENLHKSLAEVPGLVASACDDVPAKNAAGALQAALIEPVAGMFRANAFQSVIKCIQAADEKGALNAREDALREIRRLRKAMEADERVHLVSKMPFKGVPAVPFPEIGAALWDLETNLLTSG